MPSLSWSLIGFVVVIVLPDGRRRSSESEDGRNVVGNMISSRRSDSAIVRVPIEGRLAWNEHTVETRLVEEDVVHVMVLLQHLGRYNSRFSCDIGDVELSAVAQG